MLRKLEINKSFFAQIWYMFNETRAEFVQVKAILFV